MGDRIYYFFWHQNSQKRALICCIIGFFALVILYKFYPWQIALTSAWIMILSAYLSAQAIVMFTANGLQTQQRVSQYQPDGRLLLAFVVISALLGNVFLGVILTEIGNRNTTEIRIVIALSVIAVMLSWAMMNVTFCKHYARLYYSNLDEKGKPLPQGEICRGFCFPGTEQPSYLDFMYVANMIALTYSISDVSTTSAHIRGVILGHSVISFFFYSILFGGVLNAIVTS